jgi:hypothetical protein
MYSPRHLAEILRDTIQSVEQNSDVHPDDVSLLELKRILNQKIAALEVEATKEHATDLPSATTERIRETEALINPTDQTL